MSRIFEAYAGRIGVPLAELVFLEWAEDWSDNELEEVSGDDGPGSLVYEYVKNFPYVLIARRSDV